MSKLEIHINRKFTRHDLAAYGSPNPDADPMLIALLADGNDNGATTEGKEDEDGNKLVCVMGVADDEVSLDLCHYIASKGVGCDVKHADCCRAMLEINLADAVPTSLPGYYAKGDETDWTWQEWVDQPTIAATVRDGRHFIGAATFAQRSAQLTATEHLALTAAGLTLIHPDDLPAAESEE